MKDTTDMPVAEFRARVANHLTRALALVPAAVPGDICDPGVAPLLDELGALDELLFSFGADDRQQEMQETERERKVEAKSRHPDLEETVMRIDRRVQTAMRGLGGDPKLFPFILPMDADLLAHSFVLMLDTLPACAFDHGRAIPPDFPSKRDATVAGLIGLMRDRKAMDTSPEKMG